MKKVEHYGPVTEEEIEEATNTPEFWEYMAKYHETEMNKCLAAAERMRNEYPFG